MPGTNRTIFRPDAVRRYVQSREESVLPRLVSPRTFVWLWILIGLLVAGGIIAWFVVMAHLDSSVESVQTLKVLETFRVFLAHFSPMIHYL